MDLALTDDQTLLVDSARSLLAERMPDTILAGMAQGEPGPDLWSELAALGWMGLVVPEDTGGSGGGMLDAVLLVEQMGYAGLDSPFIQAALVVPRVLLALDGAGQATLLAAIARGEARPCLALTEDSGEADLTRLEAALSGTRLAGRKRFVKDARGADPLLVAVSEGGGVSLLRLADGAPCEAMETVSGERLYEIDLTGRELGPDARLGAPGGARLALEAGLAAGALGRSGEMVGLAQRILDLTVDYARVREQSGQPIGAFQAVQHHVADMLRNVEGARFMTYRAAWELDRSGDASVPPGVAIAKAYASEACLAAARRAHQVMGAIGYCEEHPLHLLHKRIHAASLDYGEASTHLDAVADDLGLEPLRNT